MRVLVPILGALALAALVLWLRPGRERVSAPPARGAQVAVSSPATFVELAQAPALGAEPSGAEDERRELVVLPDETIAGRVEVEGGIPLGDQPVVVAYGHRAGVSRLHSRRFEAPVARDGTFAFQVPASTRSLSLELESLVLSLPDEVEVRAGSRDVSLRPELRAAIRGWAHRPSRYPIGPSTCEEEPIRVTCAGWDTIDADPGGGFWFMVAPGTPVVLHAATGSRESGAESVPAAARLELEALRPGEIREVDLFLAPSPAPR